MTDSLKKTDTLHRAVCVLFMLIANISVVESTWNEWWTYDGISGPDFWGIHNRQWELCSKGRLQSPINISPSTIIFDPNLLPLNISQVKIDGVLKNTGHDLMVTLNKSQGASLYLSGGPLSYRYAVFQIKIHFGTSDDRGSEHTVAEKAFPAEIQLLGYNTDLYNNVTQAKKSPYGFAAVAILAIIKKSGNEHFSLLVRSAEKLKSKGLSSDLYGFSIAEILPSMMNYVTYDGSLTQPGCQETVTWVVLNSPMHISKSQLVTLRKLTKGDGSGDPLMENNFRPIQPVNRRLIRTNIPIKEEPDCMIKKTIEYTVNKRLKEKS